MKNKLELTWYNKDKSLYYDTKKGEYIWVDKNDPRVAEPRILIEKKQVGDPRAENLLIKGDNLLALKALQPEFTGKIKCIYIDPPFNTGSAFEHYDDGLEHSVWLTMLRDRLKILYELLREDGFIFIHLDDRELAHCKIIVDEIFGRNNFRNIITMTTNAPSGFKATGDSIFSTSNFLLLYVKSNAAKPKKIFIEKKFDTAYSKYLLNRNENYKKWKWVSLAEHVSKVLGFDSVSGAKKEIGSEQFDMEVANFAISHARNIFRPAAIQGGARAKRLDTIMRSKKNKDKVFVHPNEDLKDFYILNGDQIIFYENRVININGANLPGALITDVWTDISWTGIAKEGDVQFKNSKKPELLIKRIIDMASEPGDWILDSFAGSGTTGAVAHKMNRKWIMIEMGEHAETHCFKRLKDVVSGKDNTGISKDVNWAGGGGLKYLILGESLFKFDPQLKFSFINAAYTNGPLIRAVCKMEGFAFLDTKGILHGQVNKKYAHITEQFVNEAYIEEVSKEIKNSEFLVIYCLKYDSKLKTPENVAIKRLPMALTKKFVIG